MKARVKATGEIVDVELRKKGELTTYHDVDSGAIYIGLYDLDFNVKDEPYFEAEDYPDYWTRLEHTYAGMAMQGILSNYDLLKFLCKDGETIKDTAINSTIIIAHALVEKMKEERK